MNNKILIVLMLGLLVLSGCYHNWTNGANQMCQSLGHKEVTDSYNSLILSTLIRFEGQSKIECDNKYIYILSCSEILDGCNKSDKWGNCESYNYYFACEINNSNNWIKIQ